MNLRTLRDMIAAQELAVPPKRDPGWAIARLLGAYVRELGIDPAGVLSAAIAQELRLHGRALRAASWRWYSE